MRKLSVILCILFLMSGCAYYNTFYHAKKYFNEAEDTREKDGRDIASGGEIKKYQDAIKKSSRVLTDYPGSKYEDDALFVIGKSFYYLSEFQKAERKFREILSTYPESEFAEESQFFLAKSRLKLENDQLALEGFNDFIDQDKNSKWRADAIFLAAEVYLQREEYQNAIEFYQKLIEEHPHDRKIPDARMKIGEIQFDMGNYQLAERELSAVADKTEDEEKRFEANYLRGRALYQLDSIEAGLELFKKLDEDNEIRNKIAPLRLRVAEGEYLKGDISHAIILYDLITTDFDKSAESAEAYYEMGTIIEDYFDDLQIAKEMFDFAAKISSGKEFRTLAIEKSANIARLEQYQDDLSSEELEESISSRFLLAELYRTTLNRPDSALHEYSSLVESYPGSELAPRSLLAIGWLHENYYNDTSAAYYYYQQVLDEYPYSDDYGNALELLDLNDTPLDSIYSEKLFYLAEEQYFSNRNLDSAYTLYERLKYDFPDSRFVPKSEMAMAGIRLEQFIPIPAREDTAYEITVKTIPVSGNKNESKPNPDSSSIDSVEITSPFIAELDTNSIDTTVLETDIDSSSAEATALEIGVDSSSIDTSDVVADSVSVSDSVIVIPPIEDKSGEVVVESTMVITSFVDSTMIWEFLVLAQKYADTPIGQEAARLAKGEGKQIQKRKRQAPQQETAKDTSEQISDEFEEDPSDTLTEAQILEERINRLIDELPKSPIEGPSFEEPFVYPIEAYGSKFRGRMLTKIKIEFDGEITEVELLQPSGTKAIDDEVERVLLLTRFDPLFIEPLDIGGYFIYYYEVILPDHLVGE